VRGLERGPWGDRFDIVVLDAPATGHGVSLLTAPRLLSEVVAHGPVGQMGSDLARFVADPARCGVVVVTSPEEMPVQEALELAEALDQRLGRRPDLLVVNGVYPPFPEPPPAGDEAVLSLWRDRRRYQEREMARLESAWPGPRVQLPKLPVDHGPRLVADLAGCLAQALARDGEAAWS
jgi:anion-transporting  ArsA/GET3 family ATPase